MVVCLELQLMVVSEDHKNQLTKELSILYQDNFPVTDFKEQSSYRKYAIPCLENF